MTRLLLAIAGAVLLGGAEGVWAQPADLPLSSFSAGFARQSGTGRSVLAQVGNVAVGRSSGSGRVVLSGFLPGAAQLSGGTVDVPEPGAAVPGEFSLSQNYPNPFNPATSIKFRVPSSKVVTLKVHDVLGREVATLLNEVKEPGTYTVAWDAGGFASGVYFYRLQAGTFAATRKLLLLR